jgi:DNA repair protein RadC
MDAVALGRYLINEYQGISGLFRQCPKDLLKVKGLGKAKVARLLAAVELSRRSLTEQAVRVLCVGTVDWNAVYPREIIRIALELMASGVIFIHNHPSGSTVPSEEDKEAAKRLSMACRAVDIEPIDHFIVTKCNVKRIL